MFRRIQEIYRDSSMLERHKAAYTVLISMFAVLGFVLSGIGDLLNGKTLFFILKCVNSVLVSGGAVLVYRKRFYLSSNILIFSSLLLLNLVFLLDDYAGRFDVFVQAFYMIPAFGLLFLLSYDKAQAIFVTIFGDAFLVLSLFTKYFPHAAPGDLGSIYGNLVSAGLILSLLGFIAYLTTNEVNRNLKDLEKKITDENARSQQLKSLIRSTHESLSIGEVLQDCALNMANLIGSMNSNMNTVRENFARSVETARQVHSTGRDLIESYTRVTAGMDVQDASITGMSDSISHMGRSVEEISRNSSEKMDLIRNLTDRFVAEKKEIEAFKSVMSGIAGYSNGLVEIINVIEDIAGRTNLLSMNASIEAAHAGNYGKGFAVVAGEIGRLAHQSNENSTLIRRNLNVILEGLKAVDQGNDRMAEILEHIMSFIASTSSDMQKMLGEMAGISGDSIDLQKNMTTLAEINTTVRQTSSRASAVVQESGKGAGNIISSLADTESTFNTLFSDARNIEEAVLRIREMGVNNLTTILELQKRLEAILV